MLASRSPAARPGRDRLGAVFGFLAAVIVGLAEVNALACDRAPPDGGGRSYGVTNQVETLLLAPALGRRACRRPLLPAVAR